MASATGVGWVAVAVAAVVVLMVKRLRWSIHDVVRFISVCQNDFVVGDFQRPRRHSLPLGVCSGRTKPHDHTRMESVWGSKNYYGTITDLVRVTFIDSAMNPRGYFCSDRQTDRQMERRWEELGSGARRHIRGVRYCRVLSITD
jgi:hypothetical protein